MAAISMKGEDKRPSECKGVRIARYWVNPDLSLQVGLIHAGDEDKTS